MSYRILIADTFYDQYLRDYYRRNPTVTDRPYDEQLAHLAAERFSSTTVCCSRLRALGCHADMVILNARPLQQQWAREHGVASLSSGGKWDADVFIEQVAAVKPDVLYMQELSVADDEVMRAVKPFARIVVGQIACSLPTTRTFASHDLILSSWKPIVRYFRREGKASELFRLGFDAGILPLLGKPIRRSEVSFVGGLSGVHRERIALLEHVCERVEIDVFGYGVDQLPQDSNIRRHHRGECWGVEVCRTMAASAITINTHGTIDVRGERSTCHANNIRLFEATGAGTLLLTDAKDDLSELFIPGEHVVTFRDADACVEMIRRYLADGDAAWTIARAGQRHTLGRHTYAHRMHQLTQMLADYV